MNTPENFKVGDEVECINDQGAQASIQNGKKYFVGRVGTFMDSPYVYLEGIPCMLFSSRFKLVVVDAQPFTNPKPFPFVVGDIVECVRNYNQEEVLNVGDTYIVQEIIPIHKYVVLQGIQYKFSISRFKLIQSANSVPKTPASEIVTVAEHPFAVGETVECVDNATLISVLTIGRKYKVTGQLSLPNGKTFVKLDGVHGDFSTYRFRSTTPEKPLFEKGDKVECIRDVAHMIRGGQIYTISQYFPTHKAIEVEGIDYTFNQSRFKLIQEQPNTMPTQQPRQPNGRYASFNSLITSATKPSLPQSVNTPANPVLRPGSLYRISGGSVARYVGVVKGLAVLTTHGVPTAVKVSRVKLATKDEVLDYLSDSKK